MANYLPVLLVSVAANTVPDDSAVSTLPRGQVDYLSHNWEEEDVWRSWRNMTRQKNEIANGVRLENASWRTWWKQRNGLGTVTPETLNWLKDSDVTWLYGPLHTAVDWAPPPKPVQSSGHSALDLSIATHKPILKHRSISQFLTSDLPTSPIFSPAESDEDNDDEKQSYFSYRAPQLPDELDGSFKPHRPTLTHTKSDTHITRWGPNRAFRKDSPPRIDPPAHLPPALGVTSPTHLEGYFSNSNQSSDGAMPPPANPNGQKKRHISFNTFVEQCIAIDKPKKRSGYPGDEDEDDDEDDGGGGYLHHAISGRYPYGRNSWGYDDGYEEDAEEESDDEGEVVSLGMWDDQFSGNRAGSDSDSYEEGVGEEDGQVEEDDGDGIIELRSSFSTRPKTTSPRSQSTVSTASSSSSASTSTSISNNSNSSASGSPDGRKRRLSTSTTSTYRPRLSSRSGSGSGSGSGGSSSRRRRAAPPLIRTSTTDRASPSPQPTHVTIAPIAPTILKTGPNGYYGYVHHPGGWSEGFGDEGGSDDGMWGGAGGGASRWWGTGVGKGKGKGEESDGSGGQTPVELVYVPPFGSNYSMRVGRQRDREREQSVFVSEREKERERRVKEKGKVAEGDIMEDHEDGFGNGDQDVYRRRATLFSVGDDADADANDTETTTRGVYLGAPVPTVVVRHDSHPEYGPADVGNDFQSRRSSSSSLSQTRDTPLEPFRGRGATSTSTSCTEASKERSRSKSHSRSRSRSRSRTPSPAMITPSTPSSPPTATPTPTPTTSTANPGHTHAPVIIPHRRPSSTSPPHVSSSLLSPPPRGRGSQSYQDVAQAGQRGRSSTRTASSVSDRERSTGTHSLGSLSPEGLDLGGVAAAYTGGRHERDKKPDGGRSERDRERSRGRDRTESKRFSGQVPIQTQSVSPEGVQDSLLRVSPAMTGPPAPKPDLAPRLDVGPKTRPSASSVSSSSSSRSTSSSTTVVPSTAPVDVESEATPFSITVTVPIDVRKAEEHQRTLQPTPSNSPVIHMRAVSEDALATSSLHEQSSTLVTAYIPKTKSPLVVPAVHPVEPSTSYSISPPRNDLSPPSSPRSPTRGEPTIVGKAVEIVSSAGAFLGLWNSVS